MIKVFKKYFKPALKTFLAFIFIAVFGFSNFGFYAFNELGFPELAQEFAIQETKAAVATYDFSVCGTTCDISADWWASQDDVDVFPFGENQANRNTHTEATDTEYSQVATSNDNRWTSLDPLTGDETIFWSEMKIDQGVTNITQIDLTYEGSLANGGFSSTGTMYVLKTGTAWETDANWVAVGTTFTITTTEASFTRSITTNFSTYIGANGILTWVVKSNTSSTSLVTDYVSAVVTYTAAAPVLNQTHYRFRNDDGNEGVPAGWYSPWGYRKQITIDYTKVGSNLTDFPVLISLNGDRDLSNYAQSDGDDILFTSSDGTTKLSHDVEKYVSSTGELVAWVKTNLSSTVDTTLYMYYGNPDVTSQASASAWDTGYKMVQHLEEASGSGAYLLDSTTNANNGTPTSPTFASDAKMDGGRSFNGSSDYIAVTDDTELQITQNFTMSAWVYIYSWSNWARIASKKSTANDGYEMLLGDNGYIRFETGDGSSTRAADSAASSISTGAWYHVAAVFDRTGTTAYVYINGSQSGSPPSWTTDTTTNTYDVNIGRQTNGGSNYFWGTIDEVRISNVARTAAWISTEYNNQQQPSFFFDIGEAASSGKATWKANEDTATTVGKNDNLRLRFSVKNTGGIAEAYNYRLQYSTLSAANCEAEPTGNFADVPTSSGSPVIMNSSAYVSDAASATRQLTIPGSLTFASGKVVALPSNQTAAFNLGQNYFTEFEYAFKFTGTASNGTTYCLRTTNAGTALDSYTKVATIQVVAPVVDETHYRIRNDDGSEGGVLTTKKHTGYTMVKPVMIGSNRYIVRGKGSSWGNPLGKVEVWTADASWNLVSQLTTSTSDAGDFYALAYPTQLGTDKLLIFGTKNVNNLAFISTYDVVTNTWTWVDTNQDGAIYITDVVWSPGDSMFYIVPASFEQNLNFVWKSSAANLLIPANWTKINLSAYAYSELELRAEYFKGDFYFLRSDKQYNGDLIKMTLAQSFSTVFTFTSATTESFKIYPYVNGDANYLMVTIPVPTPSPHFDIKYSTNGTDFTTLTTAPILSTMGTHSESQAYAYPPDANGRFLVFNSRNGDYDNNYVASYYSDGTLHDKLTGYMGHYTERRKIVDGNYIVQGGELFLDTSPYSDIKLYLDGAASWKAAEDTTTTTDKDVNLRARFSVKNTGGIAEAYNYRLQYSTLSAANCEAEPTGNFADVPTSAGSAVIMASSAYVSDTASTTRQLTIPTSSTFASGKVVALSSNQTASFNLNQNNFTEFEYAFKFTSTASPSTDYCFRLKNGATAALDSYTKVAKITTMNWVAGVILNQNHYRWRDDSTALNTDGGWLATQDTIYSPITKNAPVRLRIEIANTGNAAANSYTYRLESALRVGASCSDGDETFAAVPVTATTEHWEMVDSSQYADGGTITASRLTATGVFINGKAVEYSSNQTTAFSLTNGNYTEFEYAIQATNNAVNSGIYCFRPTNAGSTANFTYSLYPQITFSFLPATGDLTSVVFDTGVAKPAYNSILWKGTLLAGKVKFQIAASSDPADPSWGSLFIGNNGVNPCGSVFWYEPSGPNVPVSIGCFSNFNNKRYFKYKVQLCSSSDCSTPGTQTPVVEDIIINWSP